MPRSVAAEQDAQQLDDDGWYLVATRGSHRQFKHSTKSGRVTVAVTVEDPDAEGEQRFITVGLGNAGELLVLVWTECGDDCRPISARRPTRKERKHDES